MRSPSARRLAGSLLVSLSALAAGCDSKAPPPPTPTPPAPEVLHTTYRVIAGVSMGALGASMIGLHHPELFDGVVALGGPMDASYLGTHMIEHQLMAGFCTREELEAQLARDPAGLNDPSLMTCTHDVAGTISTEHDESFNHWRFTSSGGHFTRSSYLDLFYDLTNAFGNLTSYNPDSVLAPQGVPEDLVVNPPATLCAQPYRIEGKLSDPSGHPVYNAEYNPDGKYDAITFCDGEESPIYYCVQSKREVDFCAGGGGQVVPRGQELSYAQTFCGTDTVGQATDDSSVDPAVLDIYLHAQGRFDPCREHFRPVRVAIAFDYNGNGRRDYAEPVVNNSHERYDDVGTDGCADALEDGHGGCVSDPADSPFASGMADPNGDDYDLLHDPFGTENDWRHEDGEPYRDDGLDGVPGTADYGEGNGRYDESPGLAKLHSYDPRTHYTALSTLQKHQLDLYLEGGIRDVFNFGVAAQVFAGAVRGDDATRLSEFHGFAQVFSPLDPQTEDNAHGDAADWAAAAPNTLELYGDPDASQADILAGDGDHVGTNLQALLRFGFMESWVASRWRALPLPPKSTAPGSFNDRSKYLTYHSDALGADRDFSIYLPPGYDDPALADQRYPVLYVLHGYGQDATSLAATAIALFEPPMSSIPRTSPRLDGRKYIVVFPSGRCCFENTTSGARDCTLAHDGDPAWRSMCTEGSFYVNASGPHQGDAPAYEDGLIDLFHYVDAHYRTLAPADVTER